MAGAISPTPISDRRAPNVRLFGQVANLNQQSLGSPDWGVVSSLQVRHRYDLGLQDKAAIESQFTAYANRQFQISAANVSLLDLNSGPRFQVFNGIFEDLTLKPFGALGYIWVNDTPYYGSYGAGLEAAVLLSDRLRNVSTFVFRKHDAQNTWYLPTNSQFRGMEYSATSIFQFQLSPIVQVFAILSGQRFEAESDAVAELSAGRLRRRLLVQVHRSDTEEPGYLGASACR